MPGRGRRGKVVSALEDPNPQVNGRGTRLRRRASRRSAAEGAAGINAGFLMREITRPLFHLKWRPRSTAASPPPGESKWITGRGARRRPALRATHDAILVGANTSRGRSGADLPLAGLRPIRRPDRADRRRDVAGSKLALTASKTPVWRVLHATAPAAAREACRRRVSSVIEVGVDDAGPGRRRGGGAGWAGAASPAPGRGRRRVAAAFLEPVRSTA